MRIRIRKNHLATANLTLAVGRKQTLKHCATIVIAAAFKASIEPVRARLRNDASPDSKELT
jgi:hypothetical protein